MISYFKRIIFFFLFVCFRNSLQTHFIEDDGDDDDDDLVKLKINGRGNIF